MTAVPISIRYNFDNDSHYLDAYDAGKALSGMSRSLAITMHYLINEKVVKQAPALNGAQIFLYPARPGSFVFDFSILFSPETAIGALLLGVAANVCYDMVKHIFFKTIGQTYTPTEQTVQSLVSTKEGDIDAIVDTIEGDVASIHRHIIHNAKNVVIFSGNNNMVRFDRESYDYVTAKSISDSPRSFVGNVSSFNVNTERGRLFIQEEGRTIPFRSATDKFDNDSKISLAWSLNEYTNQRQGLLNINARYMYTSSGLIKSLYVNSVTRH